MLGRAVPQPTSASPGTPGGELRVTLALASATAQRLDSGLLDLPGTIVEVLDNGLAGFINNGPLQRATDVLVVEVDAGDARALDAFERFVREHSGRLPVIGAVRDATVPITRAMLHAQAVDVLPIPFSAVDLLQSVERGRERLAVLRPDSARRGGRVVTFIGALGGTGATCVATQAAAMWAASANVLLIDLDVQFGNAALYLNVRSQLSLADIVDVGDRLDVELLRSVAERHPSGLSVITCPPDILPLDSLTPEFIDRLIAMATEAYDVVILDVPGVWVSWSLSALQKSDLIVMLTTLSVAGIHQSRRQLELLDANGLADRLRLVANRVPTPIMGKLDLTEPEKLLRRRFAATIANDWSAMSTAIDEGRTVSSVKMRSRLEKDLRALVGMLATVEAEVIVE